MKRARSSERTEQRSSGHRRRSALRAVSAGAIASLLLSVGDPLGVAARNDDPQAESASRFEPDTAGYESIVRPFLERHCVGCHGPETSEGNLRVDVDLTADLSDRRTAESWRETVDALGGHSMPPESEPQPDPESVARVIDWAAGQASRVESRRRGSTIVLRRLNRDEYRRTIRDLTGVDFDPSALPLDPPAGGFDNNGRALTLSPLHLELYYESARKVIDAALDHGERPPVLRWRFEFESGDSDANRVTYDGQRVIVNGGQNRVAGDFKVLHHANWDRGLDARDFRLPHPGTYAIRVRAGSRVPDRAETVASAERFLAARRDREIAERPDAARWIREQYDRDLAHFRDDRMYDYGPARLSIVRTLAGQPKRVAEFDVPAPHDDPAILEFRVPFTSESAGIKIDYAYSIPRVLENFWLQTGDDFARPEAWVDWVEIEGPLHDVWPPESTARVLGDLAELPGPRASDAEQRRTAERIVGRFMDRAYRRPVSPDEIERKLVHYDRGRRDGLPFREAIRGPLVATLVSPHFLYLVEPAGEGTEQPSAPARRSLTAHELASRLSYFLWSTMPDETLRHLADDGSLLDEKILREQVRRMLQDERSEALVENFAGQWLQLRLVGANPPAEDLFPHYDRHLETSMVGESLAFFREILRHDLSLSNLVASDFVVINERLARYYGIPDVRGDEFRRVPVPAGVHRGGVATQASILTITSNGTRTSPVKRGTWILTTLLGIDPGLPVTNVGEIAPQVPGIDRATVRQRLEIHRTLPQCARCHSKIDPLGFALENFDAAGAWRDQEGFGYKGRVEQDDPMIDASSRLPDGTPIDGVAGLSSALLERRDEFHRAFHRRLLTYALGRELGLADRSESDQAVEFLSHPENDRLSALIEKIVLSAPFRLR